MTPACFICGGVDTASRTPAYRRCAVCGHEVLAAVPAQTYIINDPLSSADLRRRSMLDRFQDAVVRRFATGLTDDGWVDLGSGSGRLLWRHRGLFSRQCGIEITPAAVEFSQRELGLQIHADLSAVPGAIAFVTAWHSLEHFPAAALLASLAELRDRLPAGGRVVVSVPNNDSWQCRWFGSRYAFFDVPNHLHQFSPDSLRRVFAAHGFRVRATLFSWPYNVFGWVQALLNLAQRKHNYLYYRLKRRAAARSWRRDFLNFALLPAAAPIGGALALLECLARDRQGVLTWCFERIPAGAGHRESAG